MSLNAPYSLAKEPDGSIQISKSGTNPFWTELHPCTSSSSHGTGQQQMAAAVGMKDDQNRTEESRESRGRSSNSYVPPDTVLAQTDHNTRRNLDSANVDDPEASSSLEAGLGYPAPAESSSVQSSQATKVQSQELKQNQPQVPQFSGKSSNPTMIAGIANNHVKNQRPNSLQIITSSKAAATDQPVKGILKKPSGSVSFDTTVQVSEGGGVSSEIVTTAESTGFNESGYSGI
jgi:hypothetical protein